MNPLKYRLFELIAHHYGRFTTTGMFKMSEATGISYRTVQRDVYRKYGQGCIPIDRLKLYADFFSVPICKLLNQKQTA